MGKLIAGTGAFGALMALIGALLAITGGAASALALGAALAGLAGAVISASRHRTGAVLMAAAAIVGIALAPLYLAAGSVLLLTAASMAFLGATSEE